jgi:hypothetical protein
VTKDEYEARIAKLKSRYSYLFAGQHLEHDIAPGWLAIVEELCHQIDEALAEDEKPAVHFLQIKEKLGSLRAYLKFLPVRIDIVGTGGERLSGDKAAAPDIASRLTPFVIEAEEKSFRTCEFCGTAGRLRTDRDWIRTLCDKHASTHTPDPNDEFESTNP